MASSYPAGLDDLNEATRPGLTHGDVADAIEAVQATLGLNPQGTKADLAARLAALAQALVPGPISGYYLRSGAALTTQTLPSGRVRVMPFPVGKAFTCNALNWRVTAGQAGATFQPVIYLPNEDGLPGDLLVAGSEESAATTGTFDTSITPTEIPSGLIFVGGLFKHTTSPTYYVSSNTAPGVAGFFSSTLANNTAMHSGYDLAATTPPANWGASHSPERFIPAVFLRAA